MKNILFPTDFSETAKNAFQYALQLANETEARITVMAVYHLPINEAGRVQPDEIQHMLRDKKQQILDKIDDFVQDAPEARLARKHRADYGLFIAQEIADAARHEGFDLIVMGTKGTHNQLEKILGSVTTHTMMQASCPVLAVPQGAEFSDIENIAYATNFRPTDELAIGQLMEFAGRMSAAVHFVHINTAADSSELEDQFDLQDYPFKFTEFSVINNPSIVEGIEEYVKRKHIDLLALYIPHRRLWERLFHTSISKKMTFHTKIPLMSFKG